MVILSFTVPIYAYMLGASPLLIGLIGGSGSLVYSLMPLLFGLISDRLGRKRLLVSSMFIHSFSAILYSSVYEPTLLIPIKVVEWLAAASFWPSVEALIVEASEKPIEKTLRMFNISWGSAVIVGPVIAGNLIEYLNVNTPFFLAASISFTVGLSSLALIRETFKKQNTLVERQRMRRDKGGLSKFLITISSILLFSFTSGIVYSLFPAFALSLEISPNEIGFLILVIGLFRIIAFFKAEKLERKIGKVGVFLIGSTLLASASLGIAYGKNVFTFTTPLALLGFAFGASYSSALSFMLSRESGRGSAAGAFESMLGLGYFIGSVIGGTVAEINQSMPYIFASTLGFMTGLAQLIAVWKKHIKF